MSIAGTAPLNEGLGVRDHSVDDGLSSNTLGTCVGGATLGEGKADLSVVDGDALESPTPVPDGVNS